MDKKAHNFIYLVLLCSLSLLLIINTVTLYELKIAMNNSVEEDKVSRIIADSQNAVRIYINNNEPEKAIEVLLDALEVAPRNPSLEAMLESLKEESER